MQLDCFCSADSAPVYSFESQGFEARSNDDMVKKRMEIIQQHQEMLRKSSVSSNPDAESLQRALQSSFRMANNYPTTAQPSVSRSQAEQTQLSLVAAIEQQQAVLASQAAKSSPGQPPVTSPPSTSVDPITSSSPVTIASTNPLFRSSEQHYTDTFKKAQQAVNGDGHQSLPTTTMSSAAADVTRDVKDTIESISKGARMAEDAKEYPAIAPMMMLPVFNSYFQNVKYSLAHKGYEVGVDDQFRAIDYSSRPVDEIFRKAQQNRDKDAHLLNNPGFRKSISPQHRLETLKEAELIQQAQQNALRTSCPIGIANPMREKSPNAKMPADSSQPTTTASPIERTSLKRESPSGSVNNGDSSVESGTASASETIADSPEEKRLRIASASDED
ncbi:hypothetical protein L596_029799 [Steinernema carpocapsae]|uniref:Uncharacterized protein n=1 Tax=Steinernema carpocapsae TaxID=34508 RepID=A0A4U5LQV8_STECR|nr:hypothetical protein L596_029799 [Steinernema carpocapsae]